MPLGIWSGTLIARDAGCLRWKWSFQEATTLAKTAIQETPADAKSRADVDWQF